MRGTLSYMSTKACTAEPGCEGEVIAKDYCRKHYTRWKRYGDPLATKFDRASGPDAERWMQKVRVESPGCWIWTGGLDDGGYGQYMVVEDGKRKSKRAHRYIYELLVGPLDPKDDLDHWCRVHACCNPDHLEPVPHRTNVLRGYSPTAQNARKERCPKGHPLNGVRATGRYCRTCDRASQRATPLTPEEAFRLGLARGRREQLGEADSPAVAALEEIERRRKYQREYMRDRRARERAEKVAAVAQGATQAV